VLKIGGVECQPLPERGRKSDRKSGTEREPPRKGAEGKEGKKRGPQLGEGETKRLKTPAQRNLKAGRPKGRRGRVKDFYPRPKMVTYGRGSMGPES